MIYTLIIGLGLGACLGVALIDLLRVQPMERKHRDNSTEIREYQREIALAVDRNRYLERRLSSINHHLGTPYRKETIAASRPGIVENEYSSEWLNDRDRGAA